MADLREDEYECLNMGKDLFPYFRFSELKAVVTCLNAKVNDLRLLVEKEINLNCKCLDRLKGISPLHIAAMRGDIEVVSFLLKNGFGVDIKSVSGMTPLHAACSNTSTKCNNLVVFLLEEGADPNMLLINREGVEKNFPPLLYACQSANFKLIEILLDGGAHYTYFPVDEVYTIENKQEVEDFIESLTVDIKPAKKYNI
jgi:ankyrin repeat protein